MKKIFIYITIEKYSFIKFYQMGGKSELLKIDNYGAIVQKTNKIFFILDADNNYEDTKTKVERLIHELQGMNSLLKSDYFISCDPETKSGTLETLLLKCLYDGLRNCYSDFLDCIGKNSLESYDEKGVLKKLFEIKNPPYEIECDYFEEIRRKFQSLIEG